MEINMTEQELVDSIAAQKLILKEMKKKGKKPFMQSKFGQAYLNTLRAMTQPFATLNNNTVKYLENPVLFKAHKLIKKSHTILDKAMKTQANSKQAVITAVKCAKQVCMLEEFIAKNDLSSYIADEVAEIELLCKDLDSEVGRLRPAKDPQKTQQIEVVVDELLEMVNA